MATWDDEELSTSAPLSPEGSTADDSEVDPAAAAIFISEVTALAVSLAKFVEVAEKLYPKLKHHKSKTVTTTTVEQSLG